MAKITWKMLTTIVAIFNDLLFTFFEAQKNKMAKFLLGLLGAPNDCFLQHISSEKRILPRIFY